MTLAHPKIKPPPKAEERKKLKKFEFGFLISLQDGGFNDLDNRALYRKECAREKTKADAGTIAKGRRVRGEKGQLARRRKNGSQIKSRNNLGWKPDNYVSPLSKAGRKGK